MTTKTKTNGVQPTTIDEIGHRGAPGKPAPKQRKRPATVELTPTEPITNDDFWIMFPRGEHGNSLCYRRLYGDRTAYCSAYGWMFYSPEERHWLTGDFAEAKLDRAIAETLLERQRRAYRLNNEIAKDAACTNRNIANVRGLTKSYVTVSPDDFDNDPDLLNTKSGVLDLRTGKIVADESGQFTYCVPTEYDPDVDYSQWMEWLDKTVEHHKSDEKMRDWLQMSIGYSLTGHTREECLFYLYGPTRSGKGVLTNTLLALMGKPLAATAAFSTFTRTRSENNFDLAPLKPARLVVAHEGSKRQALNEATVKTITGRDYVRCSFKSRDEFDYRPNYKIWLSSNHPLGGDPDDDAFWNRTKIISLPWSNAGHEDKTMKDRMAKPDYLAQVLTYAVDGARMWWNEPKGLITPDCVRKITQEHRELGDSVGLWLLENCIDAVPDDHFVGHTKLYADYENWCEENGFAPKKGKAFADSMENKGYKRHRTDALRGYLGLDLLYKPIAK